MARRKNKPEATLEKSQLSNRLRAIRVELYGERGGSEMARKLGLPVRTWYNYESGVTVPAEVLLRFLELTLVEPIWLLHGREPRFRSSYRDTSSGDGVRDLLKSVLAHLSQRSEPEPPPSREPVQHEVPEPLPSAGGMEFRHRQEALGARSDLAGGPGMVLSLQGDTATARPEGYRCVRVEGDAMAPILADGAYVAYAEADEDLTMLAGSLVVAWIEGQPLVRWFEHAGRYGVLRAENPRAANATYLVGKEEGTVQPLIRRVLWTSTPHHQG